MPDNVKPIGKRRAARIARRIAKYGNEPVPSEKKFRHKRAK
jgi:hypothetical protein